MTSAREIYGHLSMIRQPNQDAPRDGALTMSGGSIDSSIVVGSCGSDATHRASREGGVGMGGIVVGNNEGEAGTSSAMMNKARSTPNRVKGGDHEVPTSRGAMPVMVADSRWVDSAISES